MRIKVIGQQFDCDDNMIDEIQLVTDATVKKENNIYIIDYTEKGESPEDTTTTRLRVSDDVLVMTKISIVSSTLEFELNKKCHSIYSTIYGDFKMVITTTEYSHSLTDEGTGDIRLKYMIKMGDNEPYSNLLQIKLY